MAGKIGQLNVTIGANIKGFEDALKGIERNVARFQRSFQTIGTNLTQAISLPLAALGASAVKAFGEFEGLEKAFRAVADESVNVTQEIERLRKIAEAPGLGFNEAVKASTRLQAVGLSAGEAARVVEQFGNAVARSGGGRTEFDGAILALTQVAAKGKISAEEINQLNERIFEIRPALQAAFGTSNSEELQKLGISAEEFIAKTTEEFAKLERVQGGLSNSFENFSDSIRTSLSTLGREISQAIDLPGILDKISTGLNRVTTFFKNLSPEAKKAAVQIGLIALATGPVLIGISKLASVFTLVTQGAKLLLGGLKTVAAGLTLLATPVGATIAGITALLAGLAFLYDRFEGVRRIVNGVADSIKTLGKLAKEVAGNIATGFKDLFSGNFKDAAKSFGEAFKKGNIVNVGKTAAEGFADGFKDGSNRIDETINGIKAKLKALSTPAQGKGAALGTTAFDVGAFDRIEKGGKSGKTGTEGTKATTEEVQAIFDQRALDALNGVPAVLNTISDGFSRAAGNAAKLNEQSALFGAKVATLGSAALEVQKIPDGLTVAAEKSSALTASLSELGIKATEVSTQIQSPSVISFFDTLRARVDVLASVINGIGDAFSDAIAGTISFGAAFKKVLKEAISLTVQLVVAKAVEKALDSPTSKLLGPLAVPIAVAAGAAAGSLTKALLTKVGLAEGGLAYGPTAAIVGDNRGARFDPEVIAPLSKLKDILGDGFGGGGYIAETRISGDDLLLLVRRAEYKNDRIR